LFASGLVWFRCGRSGRNEGIPGHPGCRVELSRFAWRRWDANQVITVRTLKLASGMGFSSLQMLITVRTGELEFSHKLLIVHLHKRIAVKESARKVYRAFERQQPER